MLKAVWAHLKGLPAGERECFRFLHVSTDEVYGSLAPGAPAFTEQHTYEPNSPYSPARPVTISCGLAPPMGCRCSPPIVPTTTGPTSPEKLIPLMIVNALTGKPADLRRW